MMLQIRAKVTMNGQVITDSWHWLIGVLEPDFSSRDWYMVAETYGVGLFPMEPSKRYEFREAPTEEVRAYIQRIVP